MNWMLVSDNVLSCALVFICWWLSHQNATGREPFGKLIAIGYSVLGLMVLANALFRNAAGFHEVLPLSLLFSKFVLVCTLGLVAARLLILYAPPQK